MTNREEDPLAAPDPFELMSEAARLAAASVGARGGPAELLGSLTHLWMVHSLSVRHGDPAGLLAGRLEASAAETRCSGMGGSIPQWLVDRAAELVCAGARPRVLLVGAEALATRRRAKRAGVHLEWPSAPGWPDTWPPIEPDLGVHRVERAHGLEQATAMYALIESALLHDSGQKPADHLRSMGELMSKFNAVAVENPYSWFGERRSGEELTTVTADNRMIYFPYPKYLNAVMDVDMSAAVIVTDAATARDWGLASDEVAYLTGWADAHDLWFLSERPRVERSDALSVCARVALEAAGLGVDDVSAFDLYSCFPSSIEVARDSLGIGPDDARPLTLTGGLPYHGGPGSNYVTHAVANTFEWLRSGAGQSVVVHGNGYYLTKHALGVYTNVVPRDQPSAPESVQERVDQVVEALEIVDSPEGVGEAVAYTASFGRDGTPSAALVLAELGGRRTVARADESLTALLLADDGVGTPITLSTTAEGNLATAL
jgi:acetyl-CoA C-acetyltransferase